MLPHARYLPLLLSVGMTGCLEVYVPTEPSPQTPTNHLDDLWISPRAYALEVGETLRLSVLGRRKVSCDFVFCRYETVNTTAKWTTSDSAVAVISGSADLRAVGPGTVIVTATAGSNARAATARFVVVERFGVLTAVAAGDGSTCGMGADGWIHCWGPIALESPTDSAVPVRLATGTRGLSTLAVGSGYACGIDAAAVAFCWGYGAVGRAIGGAKLPFPVDGGLSFRSLAAGLPVEFASPGFTCGLTLHGEAYCWGANDFGQLGREDLPRSCRSGPIEYACSSVPVPVHTGLRFTAIVAGGRHACGLTSAGEAYCWGDNEWGQLGDLSATGRSAPVRVPGLPPARSLSAGVQHTCAVDDAGAAYCWGRNDRGQLGTITPGDHSPVPVGVEGGHAFTSLSAGGFTCALTSAGVAYCWGHVADELSFGIRPLAVPAATAFISLSVGSTHACAVTVEGRGYCLGSLPWTDPPTLWTGVGATLSPHPIAGPL
jgi:hypothetical protein